MKPEYTSASLSVPLAPGRADRGPSGTMIIIMMTDAVA